VLLEHARHGRLLYTGDFKLRPSPAAEPCATPRADVLIMETTFGLPKYVMPPTDAVVANLIAFCRAALAEGATPVLFAYALGKSQELALLLGGAGLPLMLHPQAARIARVYTQLGQPMPPFADFHPARYPGHVIITPPQTPFLNLIHPKRTAAVTGWALDSRTKYQYGCDAVFPLSDHADYEELLTFVERVAPHRVLTVHGFAREFAQTLRRRGLEAWALGADNQLELAIDDESPTESAGLRHPAPRLRSKPPPL
jgi:Cft2 family RNA processing exonuclease